VITPEALEPFKTPLAEEQNPELLSYLQEKDLHAYDLNLEVQFKSEKMKEFHTITTSNMKHLYYSINQFIAHHTVSGCNMNTGDMLGTGTISSAEPESGCGSLMER
jgi:fumarylacetoacetase